MTDNPPDNDKLLSVWGKTEPPKKVYANHFNDTGNPMFDGWALDFKPNKEASISFEYHLASTARKNLVNIMDIICAPSDVGGGVVSALEEIERLIKDLPEPPKERK